MLRQRHSQVRLGDLCRLFGYTRQAHHKHIQSESVEVFEEQAVLSMIFEHRRHMPSIGTRKLHHILQEKGVNMGRDALFNLLRANGLLVKNRKRKVFTTQSKHWFNKYPNLIKYMTIKQANKLWVSDITYVDTEEGFAYLFLITDAYSRKIVGYNLSMNLSAQGGVDALNMALGSTKSAERMQLIHHSDRGVQYCCSQYTSILKANTIKISMTEQGDPYENALAERVNGILKTEWIYNEGIYANFEQAQERIAQIISIYNSKRPHSNCGLLTPEKAHLEKGELKKCWEKKKNNDPLMLRL